MSETRESNPDQMIAAAAAAAMLAALPVAVLGVMAWKCPEFVSRRKSWFIKIGVAVVLLCAVTVLLFTWDSAPWRIFSLDHEIGLGFTRGDIVNFLLLVWGAGSGLVLILAPFVLKSKAKGDPKLVRKDDFKETDPQQYASILHRAKKEFLNSDRVPIGINLKTNEVVFLDQKRRTYHVLGLGVTGMGKSNLMLLMILHALYHEHPCIIIDPKGDEEFINKLLKLAMAISPLARRRLKIFRLSKPEKSVKYNPLRYGNVSQLKDKLLEALNWSEQYYQSISSEFLSEYVSVTAFLGIELKFSTIRRGLFANGELLKMLAALKQKALQGDRKAEVLALRFNAFIERMKKDDLLGLAAQLAILDSPDLGGLFSFDECNDEIDFRRLYERNEVAYFQLDVLNNADTARRLGKMIVEDVKSLTRFVYDEIPEPKRKFLPFFIDEFGSFATKEFIEMLKQARGARIGAHLFCQGLEDLEVVSHEFVRQATSNPATILAMRLNDRKTVDEVCSTSGTADTLEGSFQVEEGLLGQNPTGLGNMRQGKQMVIEHDVPKNLNVGETVLIERSPSRVSPVKLFKVEDLLT